jgi:2,3-bisphosphoglycerate-independent phosphoglycerate mutase
MNLLFLFMDGVGLGENNPQTNPFAAAHMPFLNDLLDGKRLLAQDAPFKNGRASLVSLDACLGIPGLPQSASGQAVLLTGKNVPEILGEHYGPKPNPQISEVLKAGNIFSWLQDRAKRVTLLNAFPRRYFDGIESGHRLPGAIAMAALQAGLDLKTEQDLMEGAAFSVDFTGQAWRDILGVPEAPVFTAEEAGRRIARLAQTYDFSLFEYWPSDVAGHHQDLEGGVHQLEMIDRVLSGLLAEWDDSQGLILITSDHGNLEDLNTRRHTSNPVPGLLMGDTELRQQFLEELEDLTGIAPAIMKLLEAHPVDHLPL